jgi:uncharacterized membrane protein (UPF0182 family)
MYTYLQFAGVYSLVMCTFLQFVAVHYLVMCTYLQFGGVMQLAKNCVDVLSTSELRIEIEILRELTVVWVIINTLSIIKGLIK